MSTARYSLPRQFQDLPVGLSPGHLIDSKNLRYCKDFDGACLCEHRLDHYWDVRKADKFIKKCLDGNLVGRIERDAQALGAPGNLATERKAREAVKVRTASVGGGALSLQRTRL